ncbi:MAG TPA: hypothetical protein VD704_04300 [Gaiellaceae bacterium]|nr:hypothetical protein [Gaiellaceae bacterium]
METVTSESFDETLDGRARSVLARLALSGWKPSTRVPRNPEQRKSLERLYTALAEARRLDREGKLDEAQRRTLLRTLDVDPPNHPDAFGQLLESVDQALVAAGDEAYVCGILEIEYARDQAERGGTVVTWSALYGADPLPASQRFRDGETVPEDELREARRKLAVLYRARQSLYGLHRARAGMKAMRLLYLGVVMAALAAALVAAVAVAAEEADAWDGLLAAAAGALGATMSAAFKLRDQIPRLSVLRTFWYAFALQLALGAAAGLFLWMVLESGIVEIGNGEGWAVTGAAAFAAGFSEPLLLKTVERILGPADTSGGAGATG